jgi:hypothetical protein
MGGAEVHGRREAVDHGCRAVRVYELQQLLGRHRAVSVRGHRLHPDRARTDNTVVFRHPRRYGELLIDRELPHDLGRGVVVGEGDEQRIAEVVQRPLDRSNGHRIVRLVDGEVAVGIEAVRGHAGTVDTLFELGDAAKSWRHHDAHDSTLSFVTDDGLTRPDERSDFSMGAP